jgi:membrane-associated phospholipid phosphatase
MITNQKRGLIGAGCLLAGAGLVCLLLAVPDTRSWVQPVDDGAYRLAGEVRNRPATLVAEAFSLIGSVWVNWPLRIAVAVLLAVRRRYRALAAFALAVATSEALIGGLKGLYDRPRPPGSLVETSDYSFPSGHAIAGAVTAVAIVVALLPPGRSRLRWEVAAGAFAALMAFSRVYLHAHWLSDAVAGVLLGAGLAVGWPALLSPRGPPGAAARFPVRQRRPLSRGQPGSD